MTLTFIKKKEQKHQYDTWDKKSPPKTRQF